MHLRQVSFKYCSPQLNVISYSIKVEMPFYISLELLSTHSRMISAQRRYILVIHVHSWLPDIHTFSPCASGVYIRQTTRVHGIAIKYNSPKTQIIIRYINYVMFVLCSYVYIIIVRYMKEYIFI